MREVRVDRRLEAIGSDDALALRGKAAVAQAKLAYQLFTDMFSGARWDALAARGARPQDAARTAPESSSAAISASA